MNFIHTKYHLGIIFLLSAIFLAGCCGGQSVSANEPKAGGGSTPEKTTQKPENKETDKKTKQKKTGTKETPKTRSESNDLPKFEDYKTGVSKAKQKPLDPASNKKARMFRTRIREGYKEGVNFAGHFVLVSWGCGTACLQGAIIDTRTGRIHTPDELFGGFGMEPGHPEESFDKYGYFEFQTDSRLVILNGWGGKEYGVRYLVWEGTQFKLVKSIPVKIPDHEETGEDS